MTVRILVGDVREKLAELPDASVHCVITSPPYWGLRDYGVAGQIGLEADFWEYVAAIVGVFREVRRVLRADGTVWLNLGISYSSSSTYNAPQSLHTKNGWKQAGVGPNVYSGGKHPSPSRQSPHAPACDSDGKEPRYSTVPDFVCHDHDGEHQADSRNHHGRSAGSGQQSLQSGQQPEPTSRDSVHWDCAADLAEISRLAARLSTNLSLPANVRDALDRVATVSVGLIGDPTLPDGAQECAHTEECSFDSAVPASASRNQDKGVSVSACRCGSCGFCFIRLAITSLRFKPKDEINAPHLVALTLQADGWYLRQTIVWSKPNPMPESVTDRCTKSHEYVFLLSKSERYYFDAAAIAEPAINAGRVVEYDGSQKNCTVDPVMQRTRITSDRVVAGNRNKRSVWTVATAPYSEAHFATFPPALVEPCILAGCPAGGTVLDPFLGAGTTALVADQLGRNCIGIELNPEYALMAWRRIKRDAGLFADIAAD